MEPPIAPRRTVSLISYTEDQALVSRGSLIPLAVASQPARPLPIVRPVRPLLIMRVVALLVGVSVLALGGTKAVGHLATLAQQTATPAVLFKDNYSEREHLPRFGPADAYSDKVFYQSTQQALIVGGASFLDIDFITNELRYFKRGVLEVSTVLERQPARGAWCYVPAGFYAVETVRAEHYSSYIEATLPNAVFFGSNYVLHAPPTLAHGELVATDFARDCVRVSADVAARLATLVRVGDPVLVHQTLRERETFALVSRVPNFSTPYYLIADVESDTVLAVGNQYQAVPIASLTKLMTALVAIETMSLDRRLEVLSPSLVETVIPRLHDRNRVTLHTLLELLLVESSNEAAEVIATGYGRERFIQRMNERATQLGLVDTVFVDPSGLGAGNVSSVNDVWWLTRYLYLHHPYLITLTRDEAPLPVYVNDAFGDLINFNSIETVDSFVGGKIGETNAARQTSVTIHQLELGGKERAIAIVLLGSEGRRADVVRLLNYVRERYAH